MKIFISWSGEKSKQVALALREWLPNVIQNLNPWMSGEDIDKGARWSNDLSSNLQDTCAGIICLTPDNLNSEWIHFEAGALSKILENTYVCPYLFDVDSTELKGPLLQFQATQNTKDDTARLIHTLNRALGSSTLPEFRVETSFQKWWPQLEEKISQINNIADNFSKISTRRSDRELLEETLELVRGLERARYFEEIMKGHEKLVKTFTDITLEHIRKQPMEGSDIKSKLERHAEVYKLLFERFITESNSSSFANDINLLDSSNS